MTGPLGTLEQRVPARMHDRAGGRRRHGDAPDRARRGPRAPRAHPDARRQHGRGRHEGLREAPRDPGRRLPRAAQGLRPRARVGFSHPVTITPREGISFDVPCRRRSSSRAPTSRSSGRRPRRSARCARPSRTRARASATRASRFGGRSGSAHEHVDARGTPPPPPAGARQGVGHGRAAAPRRLPLEQGASSPSSSTTRPAARSPPRAGSSSGRSRARRPSRPPRSARRSPRPRRRRGSRPASSTGAATSTTDA